MHDCHTHSLYSEDVDKQRGSSIDAMAARALEIGLASIAITDHLEIDNVGSPLHEPLDSDGIRRDVMAAKEKYERGTMPDSKSANERNSAKSGVHFCVRCLFIFVFLSNFILGLCTFCIHSLHLLFPYRRLFS